MAWRVFFMVLSGLVLALFATREEDGFATGLAPFVFLAIFVASTWMTANGILFYRRIRRLGWDIGIVPFLLHFEKMPHGAATRIPPRDDFAALPAWESDASEIGNLVLAARYASGRPEGTGMVPVFVTERHEIAMMVADFLESEGLHPIHSDSSHGGAYRFDWGSRVEVPAIEAETALALVRERFGGQEGALGD